MKILWLVLASVLLVVVLVIGSPQVPAATPALGSIILLSWDGVQRDVVRQLLAEGVLPNLAALGRIVEIDVTHNTDTKSGHARMLTGYDPEWTGVFSNSRYQPIPVGYTIFERLENFFGKENIATIMVAGKKDHLGADKEILPFYNIRGIVDVFDIGGKDIEIKAVGYLRAYRGDRFFAFFHFPDPDTKGHSYGESSLQYRDAIIVSDKGLGNIIATLSELGIRDRTLVYVTTDHGFDETDAPFPWTPDTPGRKHKSASYVFLATNDLGVMRTGLQQDIAPTIYERFGLNPATFSLPLSGLSLLGPRPVW